MANPNPLSWTRVSELHDNAPSNNDPRQALNSKPIKTQSLFMEVANEAYKAGQKASLGIEGLQILRLEVMADLENTREGSYAHTRARGKLELLDYMLKALRVVR